MFVPRNCVNKLQVVTLYLRKDPFNANGEKYSFYHVNFIFQYFFSLGQTAIMDVERFIKKETATKKAGVIVSEIVPSCNANLNFFDEENPKYPKLMEVKWMLFKLKQVNKLRLRSQD